MGMEVILNKPYHHNALLQPGAIQVKGGEMWGSIDHLKDKRHSLKTVFLDKLKDGRYISEGATTDTEVFNWRGNDLVKKPASGEEMASVAPFTTGRGDLIFLTYHTLTQ